MMGVGGSFPRLWGRPGIEEQGAMLVLVLLSATCAAEIAPQTFAKGVLRRFEEQFQREVGVDKISNVRGGIFVEGCHRVRVDHWSDVIKFIRLVIIAQRRSVERTTTLSSLWQKVMILVLERPGYFVLEKYRRDLHQKKNSLDELSETF